MPGGPLNLNSTNLPRPWSPRESFPSRKIPTVEPGIEPRTLTTKLVTIIILLGLTEYSRVPFCDGVTLSNSLP